MKILMVASEAVPFSKTGGLADVVGALPQAVHALGHEVGVVLPLYRMTRLDGAATVFPGLTVPLGAETCFPAVRALVQHGVKFYFVEYPAFFDRPALYATPESDYPDNAERFALFSRAAIEIAQLDFHPDIFHCHDWQSALVPALLHSVYAKSPARAPVLFTIHNLGYQGLFGREMLGHVGLPEHLFHIDGLEFYGKVNLLKAGLVYSDAINTVSRGYAREIQTEEYGFGLDGLLRHRSLVLSGILNGVDYSQWDPATDKFLAANYSPEDLTGKQKCKLDLLKVFGLPEARADRPLVGIVSRLTVQKGADLIAEAAGELMAGDLTIVVLGAGDAIYEELFRKLAAQYPEKVAVRIAYDNAVAHKIEAGADIFLMPSRYEPCGLNQIYSLKYGTVPVVRSTGGLDDTVQPFDGEGGQGTGFKFGSYSGKAMMEAIRAALALYRKPKLWSKLMLNGMRQDYSWGASAAHYIQLYEGLVTARGR
ncbi:MAG: glycogen synthase GlgA [Acidobacteria bacterium]|nr:glycogen synthase GlgA [Acidobacteriota bacterium]